jgi:hypothetical protein
MSDPKVGDLVRIVWDDAHHIDPGVWQAPPKGKLDGRCVTVGRLVRKSPGWYVVAHTRERAGGELAGVFAIPRGCVRTCRRIA